MDEPALKPIKSDITFGFLKNTKAGPHKSVEHKMTDNLDALQDQTGAKQKEKRELPSFNNNYKFTLNRKKPEYTQINMQDIIDEGIAITKEKTEKQIRIHKYETGSPELKQEIQNYAQYDHTIILIDSCDVRTLRKLFKAYDLNHLLMLEMAQDQYIQKVVPYTHPNNNMKRYNAHENVSDNSSEEDHGMDKAHQEFAKEHEPIVESMFFNLVFRETNTLKTRAVKMVHHLTYNVLFIFGATFR